MCEQRDLPGRALSSGPQVYDLSDAQTNALTREFLGTEAVSLTPTTSSSDDRFVCFEIDGNDPFANIGRQVEREVFEAAFGNDPVIMASEYGPYDESSTFFVSIDTHTGGPAGVLRIIRNSPAGLKTLNDLEDPTKIPTPVPVADVMRWHGIESLDTCWDGGSAAIRHQYRHRVATVHAQLLRAWLVAAIHNEIEHIVSILDGRVFRVVRDTMGVPLVALAGTPPFDYLGAPNSQAVYSQIPATPPSWVAKNRKVGQKIRDCYADTASRASESHLEGVASAR